MHWERCKPGDAGGRPSCYSSLLSDPGAKFFFGRATRATKIGARSEGCRKRRSHTPRRLLVCVEFCLSFMGKDILTPDNWRLGSIFYEDAGEGTQTPSPAPDLIPAGESVDTAS